MTRLVQAGDSALVLEFDERIALDVNARAVAAAHHIRARRLAGVRDVVTAYRTVTIYFDPLRADAATLSALVHGAADVAERPQRVGPPPREVRLPVCYGGAFGPDLPEVARFAGMTEREVAALHAGAPYQVFMLGFVPGFAYLGIVDDRIAAPRRATPRARVPAGSVGIAGSQTGVYPQDTPGGWQLIGRTPLQLFDADRDEPCLLAPGDAVRFDPINRDDFDRLAEPPR